ncbi:MAG TPA: family 10 glycosylhydrolase, partial [Candidatus Sumerlaeota bacterium]|nr:family 10 glycosylhydrolase [Candidatus Sumerlaeota bacterium]
QRFVHGNSMGCDVVTSSLLIPKVNDANGPVHVINADDGSSTGRVLARGNLAFGPLGCFAIGADSAGRIHGFTNAEPAYMALWDGIYDESPTSATLADGRLARNYDVHGGGENPTTIYAVGSANGGPVEVFTCEPGGSPVLREIFGGGTGTPGGKAGIAADSGYPALVVYGSDCVNPGANGIHIWRRVEGQMTYAGDLPMPAGFSGAPVVALAYDPSNDGLLFALIGNGSPGCVMAINAKTLQMEGIYFIPVYDAVGDRGSLVADRVNRRIYWYCRPKTSSASAPLGHWGCLRYTIPPVRPTPTPTLTPTPTPTPIPNPDVEIRALWVTRWDYKTTDSVRMIMKNAADHHFNIVLFQVRGNATTFYPSALEPWAWELSDGGVENTGRDPGWDPLAVAIREAHAAGLELHAYMNTYPGWKETVPPPTGAAHPWNTHREWFACGKNGETMWPSDWWTYWYTFLSPGHPEARAHIHAVYMEILERYPEIDGIHYDYIRYPTEVGDYSWNPVDVSLFTSQAGGTPDEKPVEWAQWKRDQITMLVRENYNRGESIRRGTMFSGAALGSYSSGRDSYFQDSHFWLEEGIIDCITPMLYTADTVMFKNRVAEHVAARNVRFVAPGIGVSSVTVQGLLDEIRISREQGAQGVALFAWSTLFPGGVPNAKAQALLAGPFSNIARVPAMPWKFPGENGWKSY